MCNFSHEIGHKNITQSNNFSAPTLIDYNWYNVTEYLKHQTNTKDPSAFVCACNNLYFNVDVSVAAVLYVIYTYKAAPGEIKCNDNGVNLPRAKHLRSHKQEYKLCCSNR